ncbi:RHS repeat domain-containing protein [Carboxylicivirga taeanensis]|uniref:RHS repeat domain-containing protein n=1 Tax=Carboxylicivirga taeanensis TaxID=1416875 RepID=UPI003F6DAB00
MGEYQNLLNPKDSTAGGNTIDFDLKGKELKAAIYANFESLGLDGAVFTAGKSGKVPYGRLKKYYRNQDLMNGGGNANQPGSDETPSNKVENLQFYYHPDHLGSSSYITDVSGEVYQHMEYFPFGETFIEERTDAEYTAYLYNGKELDAETGLYYYGARYYDPRISMWYGVDPLTGKYPNHSPFEYTFNNSLNVIDPDGKEGIVLSGQPGNHGNKLHFLINGLNRAQAAQKRTKRKGEEVTWIIYDDKSKDAGHDSKMLKNYTAKAEKLGINVIVVEDSDDIISYINNKSGDDSRQKDKITSFYYVGHATPGDLEVGYAGSGDYIEPGDDFESDAFESGAWINVVGGCRTAVDGDIPFEKSVVDQFTKLVDNKSKVHGSSTRVDYPGGPRTDMQLLNYTKKDGTKISGEIIIKNGVNE